jgi:hypothetical protein
MAKVNYIGNDDNLRYKLPTGNYVSFSKKTEKNPKTRTIENINDIYGMLQKDFFEFVEITQKEGIDIIKKIESLKKEKIKERLDRIESIKKGGGNYEQEKKLSEKIEAIKDNNVVLDLIISIGEKLNDKRLVLKDDKSIKNYIKEREAKIKAIEDAEKELEEKDNILLTLKSKLKPKTPLEKKEEDLKKLEKKIKDEKDPEIKKQFEEKKLVFLAEIEKLKEGEQ